MELEEFLSRLGRIFLLKFDAVANEEDLKQGKLNSF